MCCRTTRPSRKRKRLKFSCSTSAKGSTRSKGCKCLPFAPACSACYRASCCCCCALRSLYFAHRLYWFLSAYLPTLLAVSPAAVVVLSPTARGDIPLAHAVTAQGRHAGELLALIVALTVALMRVCVVSQRCGSGNQFNFNCLLHTH